jgi:benzoyl-CoA reductase/2-hydroxyglutaryl-CoA dehydratase subunit BcrC/BadD/HgdB
MVTISVNTAYSTIKNLKNDGRSILGCFPLYPPLELLHSMGFTPVVLWGLREFYQNVPLSDRHLQTYTCSVGRCIAEFILRHGPELLDGIVMYNACDTLRNLPEILQSGLFEQGCKLPFFRLHIPVAPPDRTGSTEYFRNRIHRFIQELEETFGISFSAESFMNSAALYRRQREISGRLDELVAQGRITFGEFCRLMSAGSFIPVEKHLSMLEAAVERGNTAQRSGQDFPGVIVSGIMPPPPGIIDCIEASGMKVVDNDIAAFKRSYGFTPLSEQEPEAYYIDLFHNHHPCPTILHTGDARIGKLRKTVREGNIRGFIFVGEKFCEYEYFEVPYIRKILAEEGIRMLCLDFSLEDEENIGSYRTRIEGFAETLQG